jgi:hypothetical protein
MNMKDHEDRQATRPEKNEYHRTASVSWFENSRALDQFNERKAQQAELFVGVSACSETIVIITTQVQP